MAKMDSLTPQQQAALDRFDQWMHDLLEDLGLGPHATEKEIEEALRAKGINLPTTQ